MMWKEFEELAGYEVSYEDYNNVIEPMYMALPAQYSKQDFIKMIDKKRFALKTKKQLVKEMKELADQIREVVEHNGAYDLKDKLRDKAQAYAERFYSFNRNDLNDYFYFNVEHTIPGTMRGCSFPVELVIGHKDTDYERLTLIRG